jgi:tetratricopeptide (TPR) repeat protein
MEIFTWRNLIGIFIGAVVAGLVWGFWNHYQKIKKEELGKYILQSEELLRKDKPAEVEKLIEKAPNEGTKAYIELQLGDYYLSKNKTDKSLNLFKDAAQILKDRDKALYILTLEKEAFIYYRTGDYKKSLEILENLEKETVPNVCEIKLLKAQDLLALNRKNEAKNLLNNIIISCNVPEITLTAKRLLTQN